MECMRAALSEVKSTSDTFWAVAEWVSALLGDETRVQCAQHTGGHLLARAPTPPRRPAAHNPLLGQWRAPTTTLATRGDQTRTAQHPP